MLFMLKIYTDFVTKGPSLECYCSNNIENSNTIAALKVRQYFVFMHLDQIIIWANCFRLLYCLCILYITINGYIKINPYMLFCFVLMLVNILFTVV